MKNNKKLFLNKNTQSINNIYLIYKINTHTHNLINYIESCVASNHSGYSSYCRS